MSPMNSAQDPLVCTIHRLFAGVNNTLTDKIKKKHFSQKIKSQNVKHESFHPYPNGY